MNMETSMSNQTLANYLPELGDDDLDVLLEALEAWENKDAAGEMMAEVVEGMITDCRDPSSRAERERTLRERRQQAQQAKQLRKERSVLLRAKIITIRDRRRSEAMARDALIPT